MITVSRSVFGLRSTSSSSLLFLRLRLIVIIIVALSLSRRLSLPAPSTFSSQLQEGGVEGIITVNTH